MWTDSAVSSDTLMKMEQHQKVNHFPGIRRITPRDEQPVQEEPPGQEPTEDAGQIPRRVRLLPQNVDAALRLPQTEELHGGLEEAEHHQDLYRKTGGEFAGKGHIPDQKPEL